MYGRLRRGIALLSSAAVPLGQLSKAHGQPCGALGAEGCLFADGISAATQQLSPCYSSCHGWGWTQVAWYAKGGSGGAKGRGRQQGQAQAQQSTALAGEELDLAPYEGLMTEALAHLRRELAGIRSGRASPGLLEHVVVGEASHGRHVQLHKLGTVVARNPQLLVVEVYDKSDVQPIAQAIQNSALKLSARTEGNEVLVPVPRPSMDMIKKMIKLAREEAEAARGHVRKARRKALDAAAGLGGGADAARRREKEVQALTDRFIGEVNALLKAKEADLEENH